MCFANTGMQLTYEKVHETTRYISEEFAKGFMREFGSDESALCGLQGATVNYQGRATRRGMLSC